MLCAAVESALFGSSILQPAVDVSAATSAHTVDCWNPYKHSSGGTTGIIVSDAASEVGQGPMAEMLRLLGSLYI